MRYWPGSSWVRHDDRGGLRLQLAAERESERAIFEPHLAEARYVGEIGLDAGSRFYASFSTQEHVFERILRLCALKPVVQSKSPKAIVISDKAKFLRVSLCAVGKPLSA